MKKDIHPDYDAQSKITCSCGAVFATGSTKKDPSIETCSECHPFYTGKQKIIDTTGRVDRFKRLAKESAEKQAARKAVKTKEEKAQERAKKQEEKQVA